MELKPCPFCDSAATEFDDYSWTLASMVVVGCKNQMCYVQPRAKLVVFPELVSQKDSMRQRVRDIWNTRK